VHRVRVHHPSARGAGSEAETLTRYNREMFQALDHLQQREGYDALHGFFLYPGAYVAALVARLHGIPSIASIRGNDVGKYTFDPHRLPFVRSALELSSAVTSVATSLTRLADRTLAPIAEKSRTILNSVEAASPAVGEPPALPLNGIVVGSAGLFRYKKGLVYLFKALAGLDGRFEHTLLLAGDYFHPADRAPHLADLQRYGLERRLVFTGRIPAERMPDYLGLFDILVFPSLFSEGCPRVMVEAMALGRAVIGSRAGAIPEVIRHGENGWLVSPGSAEEVAEGIAALALDPALRQRLGKAAMETVATMTPERERAEWLEVYRSIGVRP
jgi:glycosyltransferase involved in cell wall biosynthesis